MGSSESEDRSDRDRSQPGTRASTAGLSRRPSTGSSSRSPISGPAQAPQAPPVPQPPGTPSVASSQRPQQVAVETETVPSVPTVAVVSSAANGSLRVKRSQESVPRVPQTRATKKRSQRLTQGSKADIFAAKVANAVDEQDSSDSDEAFVYDTTQPLPQQMPQPQPAQSAQSSAPPSLAGDSLRRPYRRSGSSASVLGPSAHNPQTPLHQYDNNGYFNSISSQPGYETDEYYMDGEDEGHESYEGQVSPAAPNWPPPTHAAPQNPSPRSFVVPKQALGSRHRLPPAPYMNNPSSSFSSNDAGTETFGAYLDPEQLIPRDPRYRDGREFKDPRVGRPYLQRHNSRSTRQPSRSGLYLDDAKAPPKDSTNSTRAKTSYLQRWRTPAYSAHAALNSDQPREPDEELNERASLLRDRPSLYNYHTRSTNGRRRLGQLGYQANATQGAPLNGGLEDMSPFSPTRESAFSKFNTRTPLGTKLIIGLVTILICLLSLAFVVGLLVAASQPLKGFNVVSLSDVFVSDKELVFSMLIHARNPGIFATTISEGELDIFATSKYLDDDLDDAGSLDKDKPAARTVLLGTVLELESPVTFHGNFSGPSGVWQIASVKLVDPLVNNTKQWSGISGHEFDLTVKGFLSYKVLGSEYRETVSNSYHVMSPDFMDGIHALL